MCVCLPTHTHVYICICICMYTRHMHDLFLWKPEGAGNPRNGITDNFEQSYRFREPNVGPL